MVCYLVGIKSNYITNWSGELNQLYVLFLPRFHSEQNITIS